MTNQFAKKAIENFNLQIGVHFTDSRDIPRIIYDQDTYDRFAAKITNRGLDNFIATYREMETENDVINTKYATCYTYSYEHGKYVYLYGSGDKVQEVAENILQRNKELNPHKSPDTIRMQTTGCIYFHKTIENMELELNMKLFDGVKKVAV